MEQYLSRSNWYLTNTTEPPLIPELIYIVYKTYIQQVLASDQF